jgi:hypothetical protein
VSEIKPADFEVMNLRGGSFYRVQSNKGSAMVLKSGDRQEEYVSQQDRRNSLSHFG